MAIATKASFSPIIDGCEELWGFTIGFADERMLRRNFLCGKCCVEDTICTRAMFVSGVSKHYGLMWIKGKRGIVVLPLSVFGAPLSLLLLL